MTGQANRRSKQTEQDTNGATKKEAKKQSFKSYEFQIEGVMNQSGQFGRGHGFLGFSISRQRELGWFLFVLGGLLTIFISPLRILGLVMFFIGFLFIVID